MFTDFSVSFKPCWLTCMFICMWQQLKGLTVFWCNFRPQSSFVTDIVLWQLWVYCIYEYIFTLFEWGEKRYEHSGWRLLGTWMLVRNNIKVKLEEIGFKGADLIEWDHDCVHWWASCDLMRQFHKSRESPAQGRFYHGIKWSVC